MISEQAIELIKKYGGAVPRYTSYPTAVQFNDRFTSQGSISCLKSVQAGEPVSLYIHIPFCHSLCHYCGCHTKIVNHTGVISAYIDTLCDEIRLAASYLPKTLIISRVHFGGGSPNYAPMADIGKVLDTIRTAFPASADMQIDMECDPRLLNNVKIKDLSSLGLHRVSLGIQDFDEKVQKAVNRIQTLEQIHQQMKSLRENGIHDINFDLIVGLPEQTLETVRRTAAETVKIRPSRIAVFAYAHVPWMKKHQKLLEKYSFPSPEDRFLMQEEIQNILCSAGYNAIGIDHYALPEDSLSLAQKAGTMQRNFQGYTDDPAAIILGFGLSAISQFRNVYTQNKLDALSYRKCIEAGRLPVGKGYTLSEDDIVARNAIMQIMCHFHLDMKEYPSLPAVSGHLASLEQDGLIIRQGNDTIRITDIGKPFTRVVASCFDPYFQDSSYKKEGRHAKAI
jgi:oxygen-independent coproporphyrinogen-3 oxidase